MCDACRTYEHCMWAVMVQVMHTTFELYKIDYDIHKYIDSTQVPSTTTANSTTHKHSYKQHHMFSCAPITQHMHKTANNITCAISHMYDFMFAITYYIQVCDVLSCIGESNQINIVSLNWTHIAIITYAGIVIPCMQQVTTFSVTKTLHTETT